MSLQPLENKELSWSIIGKSAPLRAEITIRKSQVLFIAGGAFNGLEEIIQRRLQGQRWGTLRMDAPHDGLIDPSHPFANVTHQDLIEYGFIPEFVARFPVLVPLHQLTTDDLVRVLREPRYALVKQYAAFFKAQGIELEFDESALMAVASEVIAMGLGARGLRAVLERTLVPVMFELPLRKEIRRCRVTEKTVTDRTFPELFCR